MHEQGGDGGSLIKVCVGGGGGGGSNWSNFKIPLVVLKKFNKMGLWLPGGMEKMEKMEKRMC